jgi:hypothetical protein
MRSPGYFLAFVAILASMPLSWWLFHRQTRPQRPEPHADASGIIAFAGDAGQGASDGGACSGGGDGCG